jgi:hypothetical protein
MRRTIVRLVRPGVLSLIVLALLVAPAFASTAAGHSAKKIHAITVRRVAVMYAATGHPFLILRADDITAIRARIAAGQEPQASAWSTFANGRLRAAMKVSPAEYTGPFRGGDIHATFDNTLTPQGSYCRNVAIAYALTGDETYAIKARNFLVTWARGNTPTSLADYDSIDTGQMQAPGAFSFAYAYDLTYNSPAYSPSDRAAIASYFTRFIAALRNDMTTISNDPMIRSNSQQRRPYPWNAGLTYRFIDGMLGGDFSMLEDAAVAAMAADIGDQATMDWVYADSGNVLRVSNTLDHALTPSNDGDDMGTNPAPQSHIYKAAISGRGGTLDYCTYNDRIASVLCELGQNLGYDTMTVYQGRLRTSWLYLAKFFGPGALHSPNPYDRVNTSVDVPRFAIAYRDLGDSQLTRVLDSGSRQSYYESQLLGPVTLTHSVTH